MITPDAFEESIKDTHPPQGLSVYLQSLWYDAKGNWDKAHHLIDSLSDKTAATVHAYLHRVEGDAWNANYWYNKAGKKTSGISLKEEWRLLVEELLKQE